MILECNLVRVGSLYSTSGTLIERKRYSVGETYSLTTVLEFIKEINDTLSITLPNQALVSNLNNIDKISKEDLQSIRWILGQYGLDVWAWLLPDNTKEVDLTDRIEFTLVDTNEVSTEGLQYSDKVIASISDISYTDLFTKFRELSLFFKNSMNPFFKDLNDPIETLIQTVKDMETPLGSVSSPLNTQFYDMMDFLGKKVYSIKE